MLNYEICPVKLNNSEKIIGYLGMVGLSDDMLSLYDKIIRVAKTNEPVYIFGETGTGKDLVAEAIHRYSEREDIFIVDCGAISKELLESELFGHDEGAFTGATKKRKGILEIADNKTLFLDEITNMTLGSQQKLLRAIEKGEFYRIGNFKKPVNVNLRIIATSEYEPEEAFKEGRLNEALYFRIATPSIGLNPLRERKEDMEYLIDFFLERFKEEYKKNIALDNNAISLLKRYYWPGNVRELMNVIKITAILYDGRDKNNNDAVIIDEKDISKLLLQKKDNSGSKHDKLLEFLMNNDCRLTLKDIEKQVIIASLKRNKGNIKKAVEETGISQASMYKKRKKFNIDLSSLDRGMNVKEGNSNK